MNWLDIAVLVIIIVPTLIGLKFGIIKIVISLIGLIVGVILAGRYYAPFAEALTFISQPGIAKVIAFAVIFIGVMVVASILASLIKWVVSAALLGWVNRLGGAFFGFVMGAVFCAAIMTIWVKFLGTGNAIMESSFASILLDGFPIILALLPADFDSVRSFFQN
jgi:membrane protein required for colicin V production